MWAMRAQALRDALRATVDRDPDPDRDAGPTSPGEGMLGDQRPTPLCPQLAVSFDYGLQWG